MKPMKTKEKILTEVPEEYLPPHKKGCIEFLEDGTWWREYPNKQVIEVLLDESKQNQLNG